MSPFGISTGELAHYRAGVEARAGRGGGRTTRTTRYIGREPRKTLREQPRKEEEKRVRVPDPSNPGNTIYVPASEEYNYRKLSADIRAKERGEAGQLQKLMQERETEDYDKRYDFAKKIAEEEFKASREDYKIDLRDKSIEAEDKRRPMHPDEIPARIEELLNPREPIAPEAPEAPPKRSLLQTLGDVAMFGVRGLGRKSQREKDYDVEKDLYDAEKGIYDYEMLGYKTGKDIEELSRGRRQPLKEKYPSRFRREEEAPAPRRQVAQKKQPSPMRARAIEELRAVGAPITKANVQEAIRQLEQ